MPHVVVFDHHKFTEAEHEQFMDFLARLQISDKRCAICHEPMTEQDIHTAIVGPNSGDEVSHAECYEAYQKKASD